MKFYGIVFDYNTINSEDWNLNYMIGNISYSDKTKSKEFTDLIEIFTSKEERDQRYDFLKKQFEKLNTKNPDYFDAGAMKFETESPLPNVVPVSLQGRIDDMELDD